MTHIGHGFIPSSTIELANSPMIPTPVCFSLSEVSQATAERERVRSSGYLNLASGTSDPITIHLSHGLAYTVGSALGSIPPSTEECLEAFMLPNKAGLTAGARAWSKHAHRSYSDEVAVPPDVSSSDKEPTDAKTVKKKKKKELPSGWWGRPSGPVKELNERALELFWRIMGNATWRNLHWLPHQVLVYEARVEEGYGMRWSQDRASHAETVEVGAEKEEQAEAAATEVEVEGRPWIFRGFVEPMMEDGHEKGWRH
ncbi:hypothetical protein ONZ45_g11721 [Pleurotus djamor]|nr:hypothetical protein ONZ45_g11721 [Pleurotus djamor]